jgi:hypothetical protein
MPWLINKECMYYYYTVVGLLSLPLSVYIVYKKTNKKKKNGKINTRAPEKYIFLDGFEEAKVVYFFYRNVVCMCACDNV